MELHPAKDDGNGNGSDPSGNNHFLSPKTERKDSRDSSIEIEDVSSSLSVSFGSRLEKFDIQNLIG